MRISALDGWIKSRENVPALSRKTIESIQLAKLNRLLQREAARGGFYRHLPSSLDSLAQLGSLPFTTGENLRTQGSAMVLLSQSRIARVSSDNSSGTTGEKKRVFYSEADRRRTVDFFTAGISEFAGRGDRVMICFPPSGPNGLSDLIAKALRRLGAAAILPGPGRTFGELLGWAAEAQPTVYMGFPLLLLSLLRLGRARGGLSFRRALISADALPPSVAGELTALLPEGLFPHYGSREIGLGGAATCSAHEGMHFRENDIIVELVDGELVLTTIQAEAMPLIRYRTGDRARILPGVCPCGSVLLRVDAVSRTAPGLTMERLDDLVFSHPEVIDCRAEGNGKKIALELLYQGDFRPDDLAARLRGKFPTWAFSLSAMPFTPSHRPLYPAKRSLLSGDS